MRLADAIACKLGLVDDDDQEHALQVRMPADAIRYRVGMFLTGRRDRRGKARRGVKAAQVKRRAKRRGRRHDRRRYAHAASDSRRTITYPEIDSEPLKLQTLVLVHELGHHVDDALRRPGRPAPVSWYAQDSRGEAFAEAFTLYCAPDLCAGGVGWNRYDPDVLAQDHATLALFESLRAPGADLGRT